MEVPIYCHASSESVPRYKFNADGKSIYLLDDSSALCDQASMNPTVYHILDEDDWTCRIVGSASMHMFFIQQQKLVITTHALEEEPNVICIRVLKVETSTPEDCSKWTDTEYSSSIQINLGSLLEFLSDHPEYPIEESSNISTAYTMMDLDVRRTSLLLTDTTRKMRSIVKTACFRITAEDESSLKEEPSHLIYWNVLFVDNKGSILTIRLRYDHSCFQLRPVIDELSNDSENFSLSSSSIRLISMFTSSNPVFFPSTANRLTRRASITSEGITLVSSQVDFLDSHRVLLAISSGILCVHTVLGTVASWSENQCIMGENDTPTTVTFCVPKIDVDTSTATLVPSNQNQNDECASTSFTLGRTITADSIRKKRQSMSSIFKNAKGLLQGKSVVDMFIEHQNERRKTRQSHRTRRQQETYLDMNIHLKDLSHYSFVGNTTLYDAFLDVQDMEDRSNLAAVSAVTVARMNNSSDLSSLSVLNGSNNGPVKAVFTLHADGMIRMWTIPDESMIGDKSRDIIYPWTMKVLYDANFIAHELQNISILPIPAPQNWSSSFDSVSLTCKLSHVSHYREDDSERSNLLGSFLKTPQKRLRLELEEDDHPEHSTIQFSLVVSIRTMSVDLGKKDQQQITDEYCPFGYSGRCNLTLFRGNILQDPSRELFSSRILIDRLQVPCIAQSVAAITFGSPTNNSKVDCGELFILYNCLDMTDVSGIGNCIKIISSSGIKPSILAAYDGDSFKTFHVERVNTLDDFAFSDRNDFVIQAIALRDSGIIDSIIEDEAEGSTNDDNIEKSVRFIESFYMRRLFRSCWGRSLGGSSLSEGSIRRAMRQVCPVIRTTQTSPSHEGYLEIDTLTAMRDWASYQEAKFSVEGATRKRYENDIDFSSNLSDTMQNSSLSMATSPKSYDHSVHETSIIHGATTTSRRTRGERRRILNGHHTRWIKFMLSVWNEVAKSRQALVLIPFPCLEDGYKVLLLRSGVTSSTCISSLPQTNDLSRFELLNQLSLSFVQKICHDNYDTRLKLASQEIFVQYLTSKASLALSTGCDTFEKLLHHLSAFGSINDDPILGSRLNSLMETLSDEEICSWLFSLPTHFETGDHGISHILDDTPISSETDGQALYNSILPCSSTLIINAIENIQKLSLARFFILPRVTGRYLKLKRTALRIYLTLTTYRWTFNQLGSEMSVSNLHLRPGSNRIIDFALAHFSRRLNTSSQSSFDLIRAICYKYILVSETISLRETNWNWIVPINLKDRSKYILRLVSPLISYQSDFSLTQRNDYRETVATCLLSEIRRCSHNHANTVLLERASSLLKRDFQLQICSNMDKKLVLEVILNGPAVESECPPLVEEILTDNLLSFLTSILSDETLRRDAINLVAMESFRSLLRPWIIASLLNGAELRILLIQALTGAVSDPTSCIQTFSTEFLEIACLIHRIEILQSLCPSHQTILSAISDCISAIKIFLPVSYYDEHMIEYSKLWSIAFHHSLLDHQWLSALEAIQSNPSKDVKIIEFRKLVSIMVEAGEVDSFLDIIRFQETSIDFYELAVDTLADASYEDSSLEITSFLTTHVNNAGCLFALHASQQKWRRCGEAMDYFGLIRMNLTQRNQSPQEDKYNERKIMDDLTLSAVASLQLSYLSPHPTDAEGIIQPNEVLKVEDSNTKADMHPSLWQSDKPLSSQAFKVMAMRLLLIDSALTYTTSDLISIPLSQIMIYLAQLGYMSYYIAMAEVKAKLGNGSRPGGRDLLADAMTYLIHEFLAPVSLRSSCVVNEDIMISDIPFISSRPSASQFFLSSSGQVISPDSWRSHEQMIKLSKADAAMELIRSYTERYSNSSNCLAIEIANTFLEVDVGQANLPSWLEALLLSPPNGRGLFAAKTGNPCALVLIYIRWGMLLEAASVVSSTLFGHGCDRKRTAPSRLPENGNIDFVPYKIIDLLWDLIDKEIANPNTDNESRGNFHKAQTQIERALVEHFELMKISEIGLHSARVLNPL